MPTVDRCELSRNQDIVFVQYEYVARRDVQEHPMRPYLPSSNPARAAAMENVALVYE